MATAPSQQSIDAQVRAARAALDQGDLTRASAACQSVLQTHPAHAGALHLLGRIAMNSARPDEALDLLHRAVAAAPDLAAAHADLGRLLASAGQFDAAIDALRRATSMRPNDADLSDLGYALLAAGRADESAEVLQRALAINPTSALAHINLGAAERARKNYRQAAAHYGKAATLRPKMLEAHAFEGVASAEAGNFAAAHAAWERMMRLDPPPAVLRDIAGLIRALGRPREAVTYLRTASKIEPRDPATWLALSTILNAVGDHAQAEAAAREALRLNPQLHDARLELGVALHRLDLHAQAADEYRAYLRHRPDSSAAHANLAEAVSLLGDADEAIDHCRRAIELAPTQVGPYKNLVVVLMRALRPAEAVEVARRAVTVAPQSADALTTLGVALHESGATADALAALRQAVALAPEDDVARMNLGLLLLGGGELEEGFREFEHRPKPAPRPGLRPWDGSPTGGRGILLRAEQGYGDAFHFVRYAPLVAQRIGGGGAGAGGSGGGRLVVECPEPLRRLLATAPSVDEVVSTIAPIKGVEFEASLVSLPYLLGTTLTSIPANTPYLFPPRTNNQQLVRALSRDGASPAERRIGLVWAGNPRFGNDRRRSIAIEMLRPITSIPGLRFFGLQVGPAAMRDADAMRDMAITSLADMLNDFCETAWAIEQLELVISVDTAVAHLAGALGKPVWVMLPTNSDWRWLRDRQDSVWYPTMRLFRQRQIGNWQQVIERVSDALRERLR